MNKNTAYAILSNAMGNYECNSQITTSVTDMEPWQGYQRLTWSGDTVGQTATPYIGDLPYQTAPNTQPNYILPNISIYPGTNVLGGQVPPVDLAALEKMIEEWKKKSEEKEITEEQLEVSAEEVLGKKPSKAEMEDLLNTLREEGLNGLFTERET